MGRQDGFQLVYISHIKMVCSVYDLKLGFSVPSGAGLIDQIRRGDIIPAAADDQPQASKIGNLAKINKCHRGRDHYHIFHRCFIFNG